MNAAGRLCCWTALLILMPAVCPRQCLAASPRSTAPSAPAVPAVLTGIQVLPPRVVLSGRGTSQRFMVVGTFGDGRVRDLTARAQFTRSGDGEFAVQGGRVVGKLDGKGKLVATVAGRRAAMSVTVQDILQQPQWSFANEIVPIFTKQGCNGGGCHGSPAGRGGFKLSLFGYEPDYDYEQVTKDRGGLRINLQAASRSLLLQKPTMQVPHGGGMRFKESSAFYKRLLEWLRSGAPKQPEFDPRLKGVEIYPTEWTLDQPGQKQPLIVMAVRDDGTTQDVTEYARFASNDDQVADVDDDGTVTAKKAGETSITIRYLGGVGVVRLRVPRARLPAGSYAGFQPVNYIDQLVLEKLQEVRIPPSPTCGDAEFIRRASIDTCGITPSVEEVRAFLADRDPNKRTRLVDALLGRPEYVDYWSLKWSDLFRNNSGVKRGKGLEVYYRWIHDSVRDDKPWDQMARELLTASGSSFRSGPVNWFNTGDFGGDYPLLMGSAASQAFLGIRLDCARCHNHPFEAWSQLDYYGLAAFFARTRLKNGPGQDERIFYAATDGEVYHPRRDRSRPDAVIPARFLGGDVAAFGPDDDRREVLAQWITSPQNPWFKRSIANRIWNDFFGRGIVQPVDDLRVTNPASNEKLLDALGEKLVQYRFSLKALMRDILLSRTYQASSMPVKANGDDRLYASHALPRRLIAEVLLDAVAAATDVPEQFGRYGQRRAVSVPDNQIFNPFLDLFGRAKRETACECERSEETNVSMILSLVNGGVVNDRITNPSGRVARAVREQKAPQAIIDEFYLAALCRPPTPREQAAALKLLTAAPSPKEGAEDLMWGLLNTREFMFNH